MDPIKLWIAFDHSPKVVIHFDERARNAHMGFSSLIALRSTERIPLRVMSVRSLPPGNQGIYACSFSGFEIGSSSPISPFRYRVAVASICHCSLMMKGP